jgi:ABC-type transporter Mla MlaB component
MLRQTQSNRWKERAQQLPQDIKQFLGNKVSQVQQAVVERVDIASLAVSGKATQVHQAVVERIDTASLAISSKAAQVKTLLIST